MNRVIVVAIADKIGSYYAGELNGFFGDDIEIDYVSTTTGDLNTIKDYDMVLITTHTIISKIMPFVTEKAKVLKVIKNLNPQGVEKINALPYGSEALVVNVGPKTVSESIYLIYSYGRTDLELHPYYPGIEKFKKLEIILSQGELEKVPDYGGTVIDILNTTIDVKTFLEMIAFFNLDKKRYLDKLMDRQSFKKSDEDGVSIVISERSMFDNIINVLFENLNEGVLIYDDMGRITTCSSSVQKFLRKNTDTLMGRDITQVIDVEKNIIFGQQASEAIMKVGKMPLICTVLPKMTFGKNNYGLIILKKYNDAEMKMHMYKKELLQKGHRAKYDFDDIVGSSKEMEKMKTYALKISKSDSTVLIIGESGTGKELFAHAIHNNSRRSKEQFVAINCSAIPENLLESELFGYEEGAFTGAKKGGKQGLFESANGGTLFLDEIGEMPLHLQNRLLRVLQEQEIMRVGGNSILKIDVRIIAATNRKLKLQVAEGHFRKDLYYRLSILPLNLPPLRERGHDVLEIFDRILISKKENVRLSDEVKEYFLKYSWDGNIRELDNCAEYLINLGFENVLIEDLPESMKEQESAAQLRYFESHVDLDKSRSNNTENVRNVSKIETAVKQNLTEVILSILYTYAKKGKKIGRKQLALKLVEQNVFLGEQEVRNKLLTLVEEGYVIINKGRGGTQITDIGIEYLKV